MIDFILNLMDYILKVMDSIVKADCFHTKNHGIYTEMIVSGGCVV